LLLQVVLAAVTISAAVVVLAVYYRLHLKH
jgi:hypothetical protein